MMEEYFGQTDHAQPERRDRTERMPLIDDLAQKLKASFFKTTHEQLRNASFVSAGVKQKIVERDFDVPMIETYTNPTHIGTRLDQLGFERIIPSLHLGDALCVIRLPPTMQNLPHYHKTPVPPMNVYELSAETYARCIDTLWDTAHAFCETYGLEIHRLNPPGEHQMTKDGFYYVWIIRLKNLGSVPFNDPLDESFENEEG